MFELSSSAAAASWDSARPKNKTARAMDTGRQQAGWSLGTGMTGRTALCIERVVLNHDKARGA
jgi:hypothetical protein